MPGPVRIRNRTAANRGSTAFCENPNRKTRSVLVSSVAIEDHHVRLGVSALHGAFEERLRASRTGITGNWEQCGVATPLTLERISDTPRDRRSQEPPQPYPYASIEVSYENPTGHCRLAGTLTKPRKKGRLPAVILIAGSGPIDRDGTAFGHRLLLVVADYLTRRGLAVLRVDKRGVGASTGDYESATTADFADDVLAGVSYLKTRPDIDAHQIGLVGHSEGGAIAPMGAVHSQDVAFIVMMAGPAVPGDRILHSQIEVLAREDGAAPGAIEREQERLGQIFAVLRAEPDRSRAEAKVRKILSEARCIEAQRAPDAKARSYLLRSKASEWVSPWVRFFLANDPQRTLRQVKCPVLAIYGERDYQVEPRQNIPTLCDALLASGNADFTIQVLPGLNHLFQTCHTGLATEYDQIEETIAPRALRIVGDWIVQHAANPLTSGRVPCEAQAASQAKVVASPAVGSAPSD